MKEKGMDVQKREELEIEKRTAETSQGSKELGELSRYRGADLYRAIFETHSPEATVRALSPEATYFAIQGYGMESAMDLLLMVPDNHYRFFLDLQFWQKDEFSEDAFWRWLETIDQGESLQPLQQFLRSFDDRLMSLILGRYVHGIIGDERADGPPAEGYYTPDQGYTWLNIQVEDETKFRLLARVMAMAFQLKPDIFYQLLNVAQASTSVELEEEAFNERNSRLAQEGFPDLETCAKIHAPIEFSLTSDLEKAVKREFRSNTALAPVLYESNGLEPLTTELRILSENEEDRINSEAELTLILNAALLRFGESMGASGELDGIIDFVRGTMNLGLEILIRGGVPSPLRSQGLQIAYRVGLGELRKLKRQVKAVVEQLQGNTDLSVQLVAQAVLGGDYPRYFDGLCADGTCEEVEQEQVRPRFRSISHLADVHAIEKFLRGFSH